MCRPALLSHLLLSLRLLLALMCCVGSSLRAQDIPPYLSLFTYVDFELMEKRRSFDPNGVVLLQHRYHPVSIAQYGVLAYELYQETGAETYRQACVNQIHYFTDTSLVHTAFGGKGIGLPYNFRFLDLPNPWYSGMAQGYALSYLLRYYRLTQDTSILSVIEKVAFFMLQPQEAGGTMSVSPEGHPWIEEYPNSEQSPQVLNGFINALIGLYEYTLFFPADSLAHRRFLQSYAGLKESLPHYDTANWSDYNRKQKALTPKYLRYQIYEMEHLFQLFGDPLFDRQMRIWSVFVYNRFVRDRGSPYKFKTHNISVPVQEVGGGRMGVPMQPQQLIAIDSMVRYERWQKLRRRRQEKKRARNFRFGTAWQLQLQSGASRMDVIEIMLSDSLASAEVRLFVPDLRKKARYQMIATSSVRLGQRLLLTFAPQTSDQLLLAFRSEKDIATAAPSIRCYATRQIKPPRFAHLYTQPYPLTAGQAYHLDVAPIHINQAVLLYKSAPDAAALASSKWEAKRLAENPFIPPEDGLYAFLLVYDWAGPLSMIKPLFIQTEAGIQINPHRP